MKKFATTAFIAALMIIIGIGGAGAFAKEMKNSKVQMLPVFSAQTTAPDRLWIGTFQLVWNDFMDNILHGPVVFKAGKSLTAQQLNKQEFKKSMLSEDSYYTDYGVTSLELKAKIEKAIKEKFNEKSELLDKIDWSNSNNAYLLYAMLKKDFEFTSRFDMLKNDSFNKSEKKYNYFGISKESSAGLYKGVEVLFYNSPWDYAAALKSDRDSVILYRTNTNKSFDTVYKNLVKKSQRYRGRKQFIAGDQLKVPYMTFKDMVNYNELCGKEILNSDRLYIGQAMQTADFNMNNTGVKLKSEAVLNIMKMSMPIAVKKNGRKFYFDRTFYLFMKENDKSVPYFALRAVDMNLYKYKGEIK